MIKALEYVFLPPLVHVCRSLWRYVWPYLVRCSQIAFTKMLVLHAIGKSLFVGDGLGMQWLVAMYIWLIQLTRVYVAL